MPTFHDPTASTTKLDPATIISTTSLTPHDVLSGRGPRIQNHAGNKLFRTIVASRQYDYVHAARHRDKQIIAQEIVDYVCGRSGMVYTLGNGVKESGSGGGKGGEVRRGRGDVVVAVEGMGDGGLSPPGRFVELLVEPRAKKSNGSRSKGDKKKKKKKKGKGSASECSSTNDEDGSSTAAAADSDDDETTAILHAIRTRGTRKNDPTTPAIVAHPDLWRPMSDAAACEKVKQAFRNLSKGLISDPGVQSEFVVGSSNATGGGNTTDTSGGGGGKKGKGGRRRTSKEMAGTGGPSNGNGRRVVAGPAARRHPGQPFPSSHHHHHHRHPDTIANVGTVGSVSGGYLAVTTGEYDAAAVGYMAEAAEASSNHAHHEHPGGVGGADDDHDHDMTLAGLDLDDFDANFGSLEDLAESLEMLNEEGQPRPKEGEGQQVGHHHDIGSDDLEPNPVNYSLSSSSPAAAAAALPSSKTASPSSPTAPPSPSSSSASSSSPNAKKTMLDTLRQGLELVRRMKASHVLGQTMLSSSLLLHDDLVKLGEVLYKALAGVHPVRRMESSPAASAGEDGTEGGPSKRRSLGALDSGDESFSEGTYLPLRELGFPTSLDICIGSLLDAANDQCPDRYRSINEVEADLVLMVGQPERYLFDLQSSGTSAASIVNGAIDSSRLSFPTNKLYGRDQQLAELLHIFQHVLVEGGQREFITLTGYAGTGKTALVEQLRQPLAARSGNLIYCKFNKLNHTQPMQVIFNAFDTYCKEIAGIGGCSRKQPEIPDMPCYCHVREAVGKALGGNVSVLTDLMPNMRYLVDDEMMATGTTDLPGVEALNRFIYIFRMFIRAIASTKTPLVLFLDDLQWADTAALELISTLASDSEVKSMLFVATYREEDVSQDHPLRSELTRLRMSGIRINSLALDNIGREDLNAYVSDVLRLSPRITRPLTELVHAKTTGNILFVVEFLRSLSAEGLLRFSARSRRWEWDADAIQARSVDNNVVVLITKKMLNLDTDMQWMLKVAACLGSQSDGEILIQLLLSGDRDIPKINTALNVAAKEGLMAKVGTNFKFPHDQIEQAAYCLIPVEQRPALHLSIGRTLWGYQTADQLGSRLELVVDQLSRGSELITDQNERIRFAELCLMAGRKAMAGSAFLLASTYLLQGTVLLNDDSWTHHYKLSLELHSSCAEAQFATGDHVGISVAVNPIMNHGRNLHDKMRAYYTLLRSLGAKGQQADAVTCGLGLLSALGERLPSNPQKQDADDEFQKTEAMLKNLNVADIPTGKILVDMQKASAIKALFLLVRHAHMVNQMLMSVMVCRMVQLSVVHGVCKESAFAFAAYGTLCSKYVGIDAACAYGKIALSIVERFNAKNVLARVTCVLNDFLIFKEPLQSRLPSLKEAYEIGLQMGDIEWALTDANIYVLTAIQSGRNLSLLSSEIQSFMQQMKVYKHHTLIVATLYNRFVTNLIEDTDDPTDLALDSDDFVGMSQEVKRISIVNRGYFLRLWLAYLFGNYQLAADMAERRWEINKSRPFRSSSLANETLYTGLTAVMIARKGNGDEMKWKDVTLAGRDELKKWMTHSDWNFAHKYFLLSAEIEFYLNKNAEEATKLYGSAIESAKKHGFQSELALAYERAAMHYESSPNQNQTKALEFYRLAHQAYLDWGALTKARHLYEKTLA